MLAPATSLVGDLLSPLCVCIGAALGTWLRGPLPFVGVDTNASEMRICPPDEQPLSAHFGGSRPWQPGDG